MTYRLIRFSTDMQEVVLDREVLVPGVLGNNVLWQQQTNGHAWLYDYTVGKWYRLREPEDKNKPPTYVEWLEAPSQQLEQLPRYIQMLKLAGAL